MRLKPPWENVALVTEPITAVVPQGLVTADGVLHAGTSRRADGAVVSSGGRVLSVVGTGADLTAAREAAYRVLSSIGLPGSHFRSDIGLAAAEGRISLP